jgi:hypothetical protein
MSRPARRPSKGFDVQKQDSDGWVTCAFPQFTLPGWGLEVQRGNGTRACIRSMQRRTSLFLDTI